MNKIVMILVLLYVLPTIICTISLYRDQQKVTVEGLLTMVFVSMIPLVNLLFIVILGMKAVHESKVFSDFLSKQIK